LRKVVRLHEILVKLCGLKPWLESMKREIRSLLSHTHTKRPKYLGVLDYLMNRVFWNLKEMCIDYRMPLLRLEQQWDLISGSLGKGSKEAEIWPEFLRRKHHNVDVFFYQAMRRSEAPDELTETYFQVPIRTRFEIVRSGSFEEAKKLHPAVCEKYSMVAKVFTFLDAEIKWMPLEMKMVLTELGIKLSTFNAIVSDLEIKHPKVEALIQKGKERMSEYDTYEHLQYIFGEAIYLKPRELRANLSDLAKQNILVVKKIKKILEDTPSLNIDTFCKLHNLVQTFVSTVPQDLIVDDAKHNISSLPDFMSLFCNDFEKQVIANGYLNLIYGKMDYLTQFGANAALMANPAIVVDDPNQEQFLENNHADPWRPYDTDIDSYWIDPKPMANCQDGKVHACTFSGEFQEEKMVVKIKDRAHAEKNNRRTSDDRPMNEKFIQQYLKLIPHSPYVLPLKDFACLEEKFYYFMEAGHYEVFDYVREKQPEYMDKWKKILQKQPINYHQHHPSEWEEKMRIWFKQMTMAVEHIHKYDIVHRDLKLENFILMGPSEDKLVPRMIDFGLARHYPSTNKSWATVNSCGTPAYRPPEVFHHGSEEILRKSDVIEIDVSHFDARKHDTWTLGVCLYMMMFRRNPWSNPTNTDRKFRQLTSCRFMPREHRNPNDTIRNFLDRYSLLSLCTNECVDLIERIWVPAERRPLTNSILGHKFVQNVKLPPLPPGLEKPKRSD